MIPGLAAVCQWPRGDGSCCKLERVHVAHLLTDQEEGLDEPPANICDHARAAGKGGMQQQAMTISAKASKRKKAHCIASARARSATIKRTIITSCHLAYHGARAPAEKAASAVPEAQQPPATARSVLILKDFKKRTFAALLTATGLELRDDQW